jgi:outer membrane biosynthesis protein TonB
MKLEKAELRLFEDNSYSVEVKVTGKGTLTAAGLLLTRLEWFIANAETLTPSVMVGLTEATAEPPKPTPKPAPKKAAPAPAPPRKEAVPKPPEPKPVQEPEPEPEPEPPVQEAAPEPKPEPKKKPAEKPKGVTPLHEPADPKSIKKGLLAKVIDESGQRVGYILAKNRNGTASLMEVDGTMEEIPLELIVDTRKVKAHSGIDVADGAKIYVQNAVKFGKVPRWLDVWLAFDRLAEGGAEVTQRGSYVLSKDVVWNALQNAETIPSGTKPAEAEPVEAEEAQQPEPEPEAEPAAEPDEDPQEVPPGSDVSFGVGWVVMYKDQDLECAAAVVDPEGDEVEVRDLDGQSQLVPRDKITDAMRFKGPNGKKLKEQVEYYREQCARKGKRATWTDVVYAFKAAFNASAAVKDDGAGVFDDDILDLAVDVAQRG